MGRLASVVLTGALLTACNDAFSPEGVSCLYNLVSVNGSAIPWSGTAIELGMTVTFTYSAGSVNLNANNTYSTALTIEVEGLFSTTDIVTGSGTFELVEPSTIRFTSTIYGATFAGTLDGSRLTLGEDGDRFVFVYERN